MKAWLSELQRLLARGETAVLVTAARVEGEAPCAAGDKMLVTRNESFETLGGVRLDAVALAQARQVLRDGSHGPARRLERVALDDAQGLAGGSITLAFEWLSIADLGWVTSLAKRLGAHRTTVRSIDFGAPSTVMLSDPATGDAGADCLLWDAGPLLTETLASQAMRVVMVGDGPLLAALIKVLSMLECELTWVTSAPAQAAPAPQTDGCTLHVEGDAQFAIDAAGPGACFLFDVGDAREEASLAERVLRRHDANYLGITGGPAKRRQIEHVLAARGIDPSQFPQLHCPAGIGDILQSSPAASAVAIAAQLLQHHGAHRQMMRTPEPRGDQPGA